MIPPWVWLYGPPGVGKSSIGYELYTRLAGEGRCVGFVELDQIGMCMPAPTAVRSAAKVDNVLAMLNHFGLAGAEAVVVSGDIAGAPMDDLLQRAATRPVLCRLRAEFDVIVERLNIRESPQYAAVSRTYDEAFSVPQADITLTTHPSTVDELATELLHQLGDWPPLAQPTTNPDSLQIQPAPGPCDGVLLIGPRAVGKSMVAWQVYMAWVLAGVRAGYLDLQQMDFLHAPARPAAEPLTVQLANTLACWNGHRRQGAQRLVLCGNVESRAEVDAYRRAFPSLPVVALTAGYEALVARLRSRARRKEIWLPGDDLYGRPDPDLPAIAVAGAAFDPSDADLAIVTDDLTVADVAARITDGIGRSASR